MATTYNKMLIDVNKSIADKITAVEDDTARVLDVEFFSNGVAIDLTGQTVRMYAVKPDGKEVFNDGVIRDAESGRVEFELTDQLLAVAGYIAVQFTIFEEERKILSTQIFKIFNTPKLRSDNAIESSNEYGSLVLLFQEVYDARNQITEINNKIGVHSGDSPNTLFKGIEYLTSEVKKNSVVKISEQLNNIQTNTDIIGTINKKSIIPITLLPNRIANYVHLTKSSGDFEQGVKKEMISITGSGNLIMLNFVYSTYYTGGSGYKVFKEFDFEVEIDGENIYHVSCRNSKNDNVNFGILTHPLLKDLGNNNYGIIVKATYSNNPKSNTNAQISRPRQLVMPALPSLTPSAEPIIADEQNYTYLTATSDSIRPDLYVNDYIPFKKSLKVFFKNEYVENADSCNLAIFYNIND